MAQKVVPVSRMVPLNLVYDYVSIPSIRNGVDGLLIPVLRIECGQFDLRQGRRSGEKSLHFH